MKIIRKKENAVSIVRDILQDLLADIYAYRKRVLKEDDNEVLHQFRIAVRRSVVLMGEFSSIDRSGQILVHRKALKTLIGISNTKRDLDVLYGRICTLSAEAVSHNDAVNLLKKQLEEMLQKEHRKILEYLLSQTCSDILRSWEAYLGREYFNTVSDSDVTIKKLSDKVIYRRFLKIKKQIKALEQKPGKTEEKLHALRISYKKLRYLLETFAGLYRKKKMQKLLKEMKKIQKVLGDFHDSCQQDVLLEQLLKIEEDPTLRIFISEVLRPELKKYREKEIKEIKKQLERFLRKKKCYRKLFR
ncbi:CHAD domain-containing protein [Sulfurovum sp. NBC37-1]|uniref:CHAD domain-containing protein n=1 Tax=Sulfurovum sp. (strain NBC37-1) TaxID=387093 RepID=UPI000158743D|nr:CHAD domain-containing protein [Sulfurovum sp. NBC37-1]BAF72056.1 conserved hypothetical protein [Sulfurovum sp. NBC37-1]